MISRIGMGAALVAIALAAAACGSTGKVFFVEPKDGATVTPDTHVVFGSEEISIAAVPSGDVTEARPGTGHFHLGVDTGCLPTGDAIPRGTEPWTHFGKGQTSADVHLAPGKHTLTVQAGDDLHKPIKGLCQTITVTVQ